ncbi:MAG: DUF2384 domain-containing protein [Acidisphaera sp.]|nr:DUF2384 domain-containing protein [Acidisphaera sp.]
MSAQLEAEASPGAVELQRVAALLGGDRVLRHRLRGPHDAHEMILQGLPGKAVTHLVANVGLRMDAAMEKALGMSLRTYQRHKEAPVKLLSPEQSGRAWKFAEIFAQAMAVFGSDDAARRWLDRPALGLDGRRPIDLLATPAGIQLVESLLTRLEYGVYT